MHNKGYRCTTCKTIYNHLPPSCHKCGSQWLLPDEVKHDETSEESLGCGAMIMGLLTLVGTIFLLLIAFTLVMVHC